MKTVCRCAPFWVGILSIVAISPVSAEERPPNVVVIVADDLGYAELGAQGASDVRTPHLDAMAREGIRFTSAYVTAPVCSPSRAGLVTGRYQQRFGHELNAIGLQNKLPDVGLPVHEQTIGDRMKAAGYVTATVGKWHLGGTEPYHPLRRGFDEFFGFLHEGHFYAQEGAPEILSHLRPKEPRYDEENPILRGTKPVEGVKYLTRALTQEAVEFIDRNHNRQFFLYLAYNAVHSPMQATRDDLARFSEIKDPHRKVFAAMLAALDDGVGEVLQALRERQVDRNTLVIFLSDHGGPTAELTSSNAPLRGGKGQLYEGGIRIPFLIQWTGHLPEGKVDDRPVSSLDILPTALAASGVEPAKEPRLDGVNLLPYLDGHDLGHPHDRLFWRYGGEAAIREGTWKLVRPARTLPWGLYDLERDKGESRNLSSEKPEVVERLKTAWDAWDRNLIDPLWGKGPH